MAFTDNFNGAVSNTNLDLWPPSGGTAWVRVGGTSSHAQVSSSTNRLINNTTVSLGTLYLCDDQGSADHYTQYRVENTSISAFVVHRATDANNWIGIRVVSAKLEIWTRTAGTLARLGDIGATTVALGDIIRFESQGTTHKGFINGVEESGVGGTSSLNSTTTRQGVNARLSGTVGWLDDYEAGALSAPTGVTGSLSATESGSDTASLAGDVLVAGDMAASESGADTAYMSGAVVVSGSLSASESGSDTAAVAGAVVVSGSLAAMESGADTAQFLGGGAVAPVTGSMAAVESGSDTASMSGTVASAPFASLGSWGGRTDDARPRRRKKRQEEEESVEEALPDPVVSRLREEMVSAAIAYDVTQRAKARAKQIRAEEEALLLMI